MEPFDTWFGQVLAVSGMKTYVSHKSTIIKTLVMLSPIRISGKITTVLRLFSEHFTQNENKHQIMNVHTKWNCLVTILSSISCFRDANVSHKSPMCISGKITTVLRLFSEHFTQNENKHQIMKVHTKWNCLIPILSGLVKY